MKYQKTIIPLIMANLFSLSANAQTWQGVRTVKKRSPGLKYPTSLALGATWFGAGQQVHEDYGDFYLSNGEVLGRGVMRVHLGHANLKSWQVRCRARLDVQLSPTQIIACQLSPVGRTNSSHASQYLVLVSEGQEPLRGGFFSDDGYIPIHAHRYNSYFFEGMDDALVFGDSSRPIASMSRLAPHQIQLYPNAVTDNEGSKRPETTLHFRDSGIEKEFRNTIEGLVAILSRIHDPRFTKGTLDTKQEAVKSTAPQGSLIVPCASSTTSSTWQDVPRSIPRHRYKRIQQLPVPILGLSTQQRPQCHGSAEIDLSANGALARQDLQLAQGLSWLRQQLKDFDAGNYPPLEEPESAWGRQRNLSASLGDFETTTQMLFGERRQTTYGANAKYNLLAAETSFVSQLALDFWAVKGWGMRLGYSLIASAADTTKQEGSGFGMEADLQLGHHLVNWGGFAFRLSLGGRYLFNYLTRDYSSANYRREDMRETAQEAYTVYHHGLGAFVALDSIWGTSYHNTVVAQLNASVRLGFNAWVDTHHEIADQALGAGILRDLETISQSERLPPWSLDLTLVFGFSVGLHSGFFNIGRTNIADMERFPARHK